MLQWLLPPRDVAHVGQMVSNAFVAIDAGLLTRKQKALVRLNCARTLARDIHRLRAVAVAAFQRIIGLHARPFVVRKLKAMVEEFLARIDSSEKLAPHFLRGLHLARDFVGPFVRNMAIGTVGAHA